MAVGGGMVMAATALAAVSWWDRRGAEEAAVAEVEAEAEESLQLVRRLPTQSQKMTRSGLCRTPYRR